MTEAPGVGLGGRGAELERCIRGGGVALFPSDTVYGLACDPDDAAAVARLYALKGRPPEKPSALMFFDVGATSEWLGALVERGELGERTRAAVLRVIPGGVTLLLPGGRGLRVIDVPALAGARGPVLQSSANLSGGDDARRLEDVSPAIRAGVDLVVDGGELPGVPSTVVDLRQYEHGGAWSVLRLGAVDGEVLAPALAGRFHFHPSTYVDMLRADIPEYDVLQDQLVEASADIEVRRILELGTGMGETTARLLARHPGAQLVGVDEDPEMLAAASARLGPDVELHVGLLQDRLPAGRFDLVASALCVHHLDGVEKADLFRRVRALLVPGGRFVLADVVVPENPDDAVTGLSEGYDKPNTLADQVRWLGEAGFEPVAVRWSQRDLAVLTADVPAG